MSSKRVLTPEVLPPEGSSGEAAGAGARVTRGPQPLTAGMLLDLADLLTAGPVGFAAGLLVGGGTALWIGSSYGLRTRDKLLLTLLSGAYCTLPFTAVLPLGTLVGLFLEARRRRPPAA